MHLCVFAYIEGYLDRREPYLSDLMLLSAILHI